jgi:hypothetical protein
MRGGYIPPPSLPPLLLLVVCSGPMFLGLLCWREVFKCQCVKTTCWCRWRSATLVASVHLFWCCDDLVLLSLYFLGFLFLCYSFYFLYLLSVPCSCYPIGVWVGLKGISRVMLLSELFVWEIQVRLKGFMTAMPLSTPCLTAFNGGLVFWHLC